MDKIKCQYCEAENDVAYKGECPQCLKGAMLSGGIRWSIGAGAYTEHEILEGKLDYLITSQKANKEQNDRIEIKLDQLLSQKQPKKRKQRECAVSSDHCDCWFEGGECCHCGCGKG